MHTNEGSFNGSRYLASQPLGDLRSLRSTVDFRGDEAVWTDGGGKWEGEVCWLGWFFVCVLCAFWMFLVVFMVFCVFFFVIFWGFDLWTLMVCTKDE